MILQANHLALLSGNEKKVITLALVKQNWFHTSFTQESRNLLAIDLDMEVSHGFHIGVKIYLYREIVKF